MLHRAADIIAYSMHLNIAAWYYHLPPVGFAWCLHHPTTTPNAHTHLPPNRQQLIAYGQGADRIYLISAGELEIYSSPLLAPPAPSSPSGGGGGAADGADGVDDGGGDAAQQPPSSLSEPLISGLDFTQLQEQADPDVWDSTTVSDISKEPGGGWVVVTRVVYCVCCVSCVLLMGR